MNKFKILFLIMLVIFSFSSCKPTKTTDIVKNEITNIEKNTIIQNPSPNFQIIGENEIALPSFNFKFPDELTLLPDTVNPIAENSNGAFQLMIEDKTKSIDNYIEYINTTYSKYKVIANDMSEIETISFNGFSANRFSFNTINEENENVTMVLYFIEQDDLKIDAIVMLKGNEAIDYSGVDDYIATIDFLKTE